MSHLTPEAIATAREIGRNLRITSDQKAIIADVMGPLLAQWATEVKPTRRTTRSAA